MTQKITPEQIAAGIIIVVLIIASQFIISFGMVARMTSTEAWYNKVDMHKLHGVNGFMEVCVDEDFEDISDCEDCTFEDLEPTQFCYYGYRIYKDMGRLNENR